MQAVEARWFHHGPMVAALRLQKTQFGWLETDLHRLESRYGLQCGFY